MCSKAMHIFCIVSVSDRVWCWVMREQLSLLMNTHVFSQVWRRPGSDPIYIYCWQKYRINQNVSPESNIVIRSECLSVLVSHGHKRPSRLEQLGLSLSPQSNGPVSALTCNCIQINMTPNFDVFRFSLYLNHLSGWVLMFGLLYFGSPGKNYGKFELQSGKSQSVRVWWSGPSTLCT